MYGINQIGPLVRHCASGAWPTFFQCACVPTAMALMAMTPRTINSDGEVLVPLTCVQERLDSETTSDTIVPQPQAN